MDPAAVAESLKQTPILYPQKGKSLHGLSIAWIVITGIVLVLRFWSRSIMPRGQKFGADDWTALAAWPLVVGLNLCLTLWTRRGLGLHLNDVPLGDVTIGLKILFVGYLMYDLGITMVRISTVCFYRRVFQRHSLFFNICFWVTQFFTVAWFWAIWGLSAFACTPIRAAWDVTITDKKCVDQYNIEIGSGVTSVLLDLWILILPLPMLWKLQMSIKKKVAISLAFMAGYCVIVFTIGRTISVFKAHTTLNTDLTWAFVDTLYWFCCEISVAFISICSPSLFQLFKRLSRHGTRSLFTDTEYPSHTSAGHSNHTQSFRGHDDEGFTRLTGSDSKQARRQEYELEGFPPGATPQPAQLGLPTKV